MQNSNPKCNVHYWLRTIYYFVNRLPDGTEVEIVDQPTTKEEQTEKEMRRKHNLPDDKITKKDAEKACEELYDMLGEFLDKDVRDFMDDPRCAGAKPRIVI